MLLFDYRPQRFGHSGIVIPIFLASIAAVCFYSAQISFVPFPIFLQILGIVSVAAGTYIVLRFALTYYAYEVIEDDHQLYLQIRAYYPLRTTLAASIPFQNIIDIAVIPPKRKARREILHRDGSPKMVRSFCVNMFPVRQYGIVFHEKAKFAAVVEANDEFIQKMIQLQSGTTCNSDFGSVSSEE